VQDNPRAIGRRSRPAGVLAVTAAVVHLLAWILWAYGLAPGPGLAIPEFVGSLALTTWMLFLAPSAPLAVES
jgi:hypothetical membrane protein